MKRLLLAVAALAAATGCNLRPRSEAAVKPDPAYEFPHDVHIQNDVDCTTCHEAIPQATKLEANVRHVKRDNCTDCHDDMGITIPTRTQPFRLTFDHAAHLKRIKGKNDKEVCGTCHKQLPETGKNQPPVPPMSACTSCHNHQADYNEARCTPCHTDLKGMVPVQTYAHQGDWIRLHGQFAKPVATSCAECHDQTYCAECHDAQTTPARPSVVYPEAVERAFIHRGDYVSRHMIDAQAQPASCRRCHGSNFCAACHELQGIIDTAAKRDPHPAGWALPGGGSKFHGDAARRDITSCAACHDHGASAICVNCHRPGNPLTAGLGPNGPHPSSFVTKHRGESKAKNDMCLACHTP